jgi:hypothetical protein
MFRREDDHRHDSRRAKLKGKGRESRQGDDSEGDLPLETRIAAHLLALCTVLLEVGTREIQEGVREAEEIKGDQSQFVERLPQRITGTLRRTLPALRIANKWIKGNVRYIQQYSQEDPKEHSMEFALHKTSGSDAMSSPSLPNTMRPSLVSFWHAWSHFETRLAATFPFDSLPPLTVKLEEDIDMKGFSPLKWDTSGGTHLERGGVDENGAREGEIDAASVHPNEEQLMRIRDLLVDAKHITNLPVSSSNMILS